MNLRWQHEVTCPDGYTRAGAGYRSLWLPTNHPGRNLEHDSITEFTFEPIANGWRISKNSNRLSGVKDSKNAESTGVAFLDRSKDTAYRHRNDASLCPNTYEPELTVKCCKVDGGDITSTMAIAINTVTPKLICESDPIQLAAKGMCGATVIQCGYRFCKEPYCTTERMAMNAQNMDPRTCNSAVRCILGVVNQEGTGIELEDNPRIWTVGSAAQLQCVHMHNPHPLLPGASSKCNPGQLAIGGGFVGDARQVFALWPRTFGSEEERAICAATPSPELSTKEEGWTTPLSHAMSTCCTEALNIPTDVDSLFGDSETVMPYSLDLWPVKMEDGIPISHYSSWGGTY